MPDPPNGSKRGGGAVYLRCGRYLCPVLDHIVRKPIGDPSEKFEVRHGGAA